MAPTTSNTGLADQLVASLLPKGIAAPQLRKCRDVFSRKLRSHTYARTNQFEVTERLDGLQDKLQIANNDELADAIYTRLEELKHYEANWLPDITDLLLRLSDDPTSKTRIEWLANIGTPTGVVPSLTWAEIEANDPVDPRDQIWRIAEYSDFSSDDDFVEATSTASNLDTGIHQLQDQEICSKAKFELVDPDPGLKALDRLRDDQFWRNVSDESLCLTELQVIREMIFMLQGLPTALFW